MLACLALAVGFSLPADDPKAVIERAISRKGRPDVALHSDAASGLLVRTGYKDKAADGTEAGRETVFSDHKPVRGLQVPHRETISAGGRQTQDLVTESYETMEEIEASEFKID